MKKWITYGFLLILAFTSCEEIYTPEIELREGVLVADARIVAGQPDNYIRLYESLGFNEKGNGYPPVVGAKVSLMDNKGGKVNLTEISAGNFRLNTTLNPVYNYKIKIEYEGNTFESTYEPVPPLPDLDTVYGEAGTKLFEEEANNDVDEIIKVPGVFLYGDILNDAESPHYRFTAKKVMQYTYINPIGDLAETVFCWSTLISKDNFNIAAPPLFSSQTDIIKHQLTFMAQKVYLGPDNRFDSWILILYQHRLSESAYDYYDDLNKQLHADGKLFDPIYVQARNNLKCLNDSARIILGNFEIATVKEHRYFIRFISDKDGYFIKRIPYFYDIPNSGELIGEQPDFWESEYKNYPDE
jgi:hypothetical protein